jgi:MFS family permease
LQQRAFLSDDQNLMRHLVLAMLCLAAVVAYVQRLGINTAEPLVCGSLGLEHEEFGYLMSAWLLGYAVLQIPAGWLADLWGSRRTLTLFAVLWSLLTGAASLATDGWMLIALWLSMGIAQAGLVPCAAKLVAAWFPPTSRASASGVLASSMAVGIALAPSLTGLLLLNVSWRVLLGIYMIPGLVWAAVFFAVVAESPPSSAPVSPNARGLRNVFRGEHVSLLCAQQFFRAAGMAFFMTWLPTMLRETRHVDVSTSGYLTGIIGVGAIIGGVLGGLASDALLKRTENRRLSRQGLAVAGLSTCAACLVAAYRAQDIDHAVGLMCFGAFVGTFGGVSGYTVAIELGGTQVATLFGLMNMCGNIGAALFPLVVNRRVLGVGYALGLGPWAFVVAICAIIFLIDAFCWSLLNPRTNLDGEPL